MFSLRSTSTLCVFCKVPHKVYLKKDLNVFDGFILLAVSGVLSLAIWDEPDLRSMVLLMGMVWSVQVFLRMRYRQSVRCPHCGFDPILYKKSHEAAAQKVKAFMELRKDDPHYLLKPKPQIPVLKMSTEHLNYLKKSAPDEAPALAASSRGATPGAENLALTPPDMN